MRFQRNDGALRSTPSDDPTTLCNMSDGDIAWTLMATVLVLSMFAGLAFFEAGLLRKKNTTSIIAQVFCGLTILSLMWLLFGFSLTFTGDRGGFIGTFDDGLFFNVRFDDCYDSVDKIPTALFALFQMMFACITPLLMTGAYAERLAWRPFVIFTVLWEVLVYYFVAHWVWSPMGWLAKMGVQDFAGGIVLHTTAGVSSLVAVAMLGRRHNFKKYHGEFPYSSLPTAAIGATLLWTGWFGFNGGSALGANSVAIAAVVNSQIGATASAFVYVTITAIRTGRPSAIATMNGVIGGLAGVTPASGFIHPQSALILGAILGFSIDAGIHLLKHRWHFDDALDVSTVHGVTGIVGSLFIGFAGFKNINPNGADGIVATQGEDWRLLGVQLLAVIVCGAWAGFWTFVILKGISRFMPLRVHHTHERQGLDQMIFNEIADNINAPLLHDSISSVHGTEHGAASNHSVNQSHRNRQASQNAVAAMAHAMVHQIHLTAASQRSNPASTRHSIASAHRPAMIGGMTRPVSIAAPPSDSDSVSSQDEEFDPIRREETTFEQLHDEATHGTNAATIAAAHILASTLAMQHHQQQLRRVASNYMGTDFSAASEGKSSRPSTPRGGHGAPHRQQQQPQQQQHHGHHGAAHGGATGGGPAAAAAGGGGGPPRADDSSDGTVDALFEVLPTNQSVHDLHGQVGRRVRK